MSLKNRANKISLAHRQIYTHGTAQLEHTIELSGSSLTFGTDKRRETPHTLIKSELLEPVRPFFQLASFRQTHCAGRKPAV